MYKAWIAFLMVANAVGGIDSLIKGQYLFSLVNIVPAILLAFTLRKIYTEDRYDKILKDL